MTPLETRLREISERCEKAQTLEVVKHYSLAEGCDAWLELKPLYQKATNYDLPFLLSVIREYERALEFYALGSTHRNEQKPGDRLEFGCGCCAGTATDEGSDYDHSVVGQTAREALAAANRLAEGEK